MPYYLTVLLKDVILQYQKVRKEILDFLESVGTVHIKQNATLMRTTDMEYGLFYILMALSI